MDVCPSNKRVNTISDMYLLTMTIANESDLRTDKCGANGIPDAGVCLSQTLL